MKSTDNTKKFSTLLNNLDYNNRKRKAILVLSAKTRLAYATAAHAIGSCFGDSIMNADFATAKQ